jgi:hypothetical protein
MNNSWNRANPFWWQMPIDASVGLLSMPAPPNDLTSGLWPQDSASSTWFPFPEPSPSVLPQGGLLGLLNLGIKAQRHPVRMAEFSGRLGNRPSKLGTIHGPILRRRRRGIRRRLSPMLCCRSLPRRQCRQKTQPRRKWSTRHCSPKHNFNWTAEASRHRSRRKSMRRNATLCINVTSSTARWSVYLRAMHRRIFASRIA